MEITLPIAHYRIGLRANTPITFNQYSGSAWRGLFGHALKRVACVTRERDCKACLLYRNCVYSYIFETPTPLHAEYMKRYTAAPHPFVLTPPFDLRSARPGEIIELDLVLIGKGIAHLPYIVHALATAGQRGIGPTKGQYDLHSVSQETSLGSNEWIDIYIDEQLQQSSVPPLKIPPLPERVAIAFRSPLRLTHQNRYMKPATFQFGGIISNLLRRYSMLSYFHGDTPIEWDFKSLVEQAGIIEPRAAQLGWFDWSRYSSRQQTRIKMGGILGAVEFDGADLEPFWPLLWIGQWIHVGKGTSMGLGNYRIATQPAVSNSRAA